MNIREARTGYNRKQQPVRINGKKSVHPVRCREVISNESAIKKKVFFIMLLFYYISIQFSYHLPVFRLHKKGKISITAGKSQPGGERAAHG